MDQGTEDKATPDSPTRPQPVVAEGRAARRRRARARRRERLAASEAIVRASPKPEPRERTPVSRPARPEPIVDIDVELVADVAPGRALERVTPPRAHSIPVVTSADPIQSGSRAFLVAAVVVISFSAGFGGGFVAGHFSRPSAETTEVSQREPVTTPQPTPAAVENPQRLASATAEAMVSPPEAKGASSEPAAAIAPKQPTVMPVESGRLVVRSTPAGAAVVLDGQKRGITPLAIGELAFGAHSIEISHPGHGTRQQRVTLSERRPQRSVDVRLRPTSVPVPVPAPVTVATSSPGSLQVVSRPSGAQVFVDDTLIGTTPFVVSDIAPGSRRVRIELSGYKVWTSSVQIEPSARFRVSASLEQ